MWFALLKNPLTKLLAEKTIGAISHKLKKDAVIRQKELDHAASTDIQSLKSSENSLKDEDQPRKRPGRHSKSSNKKSTFKKYNRQGR